MSELGASITKTAKFFVRNRALLLGIVLWPMALMVIMASTELAAISSEVMPIALGALTIDMVVFALMLACIMSLPSSIARDREIGLLVKLRSMPIRPSLDTLGRLVAYLAFALVVSGLIALVGLGMGARFSGDPAAYVESAGFVLVAVVAAAGLGLILGSFVKTVQATAFLGLAVTLIFAFISGIFVPYAQLSAPLQAFSRVFPISSATSSIGYLFWGVDVAGYNPLTPGQIATTIAGAVLLLAIGLVLYHWTSWRQESEHRVRPPRGLRRLRQRLQSRA